MIKPLLTAAVIAATLSPVGGVVSAAFAQTSFGRDRVAEPKNEAEWLQVAAQTVFNNIRSADSALQARGASMVSTMIVAIVAPDGKVVSIAQAKPTGMRSLDAALLRAASRTKQVVPFTPDMKREYTPVIIPIGTQRN